jgi:hypothetical protein
VDYTRRQSLNHVPKKPKKNKRSFDTEPTNIKAAIIDLWTIYSDSQLFFSTIEEEKIKLLTSVVGGAKTIEFWVAYLMSGGRSLAEFLELMADELAIARKAKAA